MLAGDEEMSESGPDGVARDSDEEDQAQAADVIK